MKIAPFELTKKRRENGISQYRLAIKTNISRFRLSSYECGYSELSKREIDRIVEYFAKLRGAR